MSCNAIQIHAMSCNAIQIHAMSCQNVWQTWGSQTGGWGEGVPDLENIPFFFFLVMSLFQCTHLVKRTCKKQEVSSNCWAARRRAGGDILQHYHRPPIYESPVSCNRSICVYVYDLDFGLSMIRRPDQFVVWWAPPAESIGVRAVLPTCAVKWCADMTLTIFAVVCQAPLIESQATGHSENTTIYHLWLLWLQC